MGLIIVATTAVWWVRSLRLLGRGVRNLAGRGVRRGVVVDQAERWWKNADGDGYPLWYLAVDDGTGTEIAGWEVAAEIYQTTPLGVFVEARVSGDGRHLYSITVVPRSRT